jgi:OmcA/MtrC family decaheme c-type cytochrome
VTNARLSGLPDQWFFDLATGTQVTDAAKKRRQVVDDAKCLKCHDLLRGHGGSRIAIADCVTCHNPYAVAAANDPVTNNEAFDMKYLIHKIHTGEDSQATVPYFGDDFKEVRYPGIKGDCLACHATDTYILPLKSGVVGTVLDVTRDTAATTNNLKGEITLQSGPYASACMSCHDNPTFQIEHLEPMGGLEICTNCHGAGSIKAVENHPIKKF